MNPFRTPITDCPALRAAGVATLLLAAVAPALGQAARIDILNLPGSGTDPERIDHDRLVRIEGVHAVIDAAAVHRPDIDPGTLDLHHLRFRLHNYLVHHDGRFWCLWSEGPPIEDEPTQEVRYATSTDGLAWSQPATVTGTPAAPYAFIARGFWVRDGELLALAAHFKGKGAFGTDKELELWAYAWDAKSGTWRFETKVYDNAINNFPPQRLASGDWIMSRRDARFNVSVLVGGQRTLNDWQVFPVVERGSVPGFSPDEPILWAMPDASLVALFRDNGGTQRLFHALSTDQGRTWSRPAPTNFPNATSKFFALRTSRGERVLISNANPRAGRRQLHLSLSADGRTFTRMAQLAIPAPKLPRDLARLEPKFRTGVASLQYPHAIKHDDALWIAFSRNKKQIELLRVPLAALDRLLPGP